MSGRAFLKTLAIQVALAVAVAVVINRVPVLRELTRADR